MTITLSRTRQHGVMTAGDSETLAGTATDSAGTVIDLTGATITYQLTDGAEVLVAKSLSDGITVTSAAAGTFAVTLDPDDTAGLEASTYWHSASITSSGGTVTTILRGRLRIARITSASGRTTAGTAAETWGEMDSPWGTL